MSVRNLPEKQNSSQLDRREEHWWKQFDIIKIQNSGGERKVIYQTSHVLHWAWRLTFVIAPVCLTNLASPLFCVTVFFFLLSISFFRFEFCVSVLSFVILFWVLWFCFGFGDSVLGFVILFCSYRPLYETTGVFFAWACATAEQAICMEAHHRVCLHQTGASQSYHRDYFARWSWRMCSWFNKMCTLGSKDIFFLSILMVRGQAASTRREVPRRKSF